MSRPTAQGATTPANASAAKPTGAAVRVINPKSPAATRRSSRRATPAPDPFDRVLAGFAAAARQSALPGRLDRIPNPEAFGARLAAIAEAQATWAAAGRYMTVAEAVTLLGVSSRQAVHQRLGRRTLLGMDLAGQTVLPAWQFDGSSVRPEVARVLKLLRPAGLSDEATVSWFASPQPELDGATPIEWLGTDPERLYEAARHTAGSLCY